MLGFDRVRLESGRFHLQADFSLPEGALVAVIGPSGAGKSTLLAAVAGFQPLAGGQIRWAGTDLAGLAPGDRPVSMLFQDGNLFAHLSVAQNVGLGLRPDLRLSPVQITQVDAALAQMGLAGMGKRRPGTLSGGQQSRVALARVMLQARPVLLLDEPFAALGPALTVEMLALVGQIATKAGTTVLMVTHHPAEALAFAPLTILVADGVAAAPAPTADLLANPPAALALYLGSAR